MIRAGAIGLLMAAGLAASGCGSDGGSSGGVRTVVERTTRVDVVEGLGAHGSFDPRTIYKQVAPGVVTVFSIGGSANDLLGGGDDAQGSGFVISASGEVATNAHVVTSGRGSSLRAARQVFVAFGNGDRVAARIVGWDPNADVALLRVDPKGLTLRPLALATSLPAVGSPVAAIGSPFGEPQSLSVGVISGLDRSIDSLTGFQISGVIQTDAAINHGNSGGPLVDGEGHVLGINSQIESTGGGGEGVGFAVPAAAVARSLAQLRAKGRVDYAYLGISTVPVYPQLADRFGLRTPTGAWIQEITDGSPAAKAGLRGGKGNTAFQASRYRTGGDVVVEVDGRRIEGPDDVSVAISRRNPGDRIKVVVLRAGKRTAIGLTLAKRPGSTARRP